MSNPTMEAQIKDLLELKRMREELDNEITQAEEAIKAVMGDEETLLAGAFKVTWTPYTTSRFDSTRFKKGSCGVSSGIHQDHHDASILCEVSRCMKNFRTWLDDYGWF